MTIGVLGLVLGFHLSQRFKNLEEGRTEGRQDPRDFYDILDTRQFSPAEKMSIGTSSHGIKSLRGQLDLIQRGGQENLLQVERMSITEIQEFLEVIKDDVSSFPNTVEELKIHDAMIAATSELVRRDGESALEWAANKWPDDFKNISPFGYSVCELLAAALHAQSPEIAKSWIDRLTNYEEGNLTINLAGEQALRESIESWEGLRKTHGDKIFLTHYRWSRFPDDFDYKRFFSEYPTIVAGSGMMEAASAKNPDEAWEILREMNESDQQARIVRHFIGGLRRRMKGDLEAYSWVASRMDTLPVETRTEVIGDLVQHLDADTILTPVLMSALQNNDERIIAASLHISPGEITEERVKLLKLLESPDLQASAILMAIDDPQQRRLPSVFEKADDSDFYRHLSEYMNLPQEQHLRIMAHLRERNVKTGNTPEK